MDLKKLLRKYSKCFEKKLVIFFCFFINVYTVIFSYTLPPSCRFYPSCAQYSKQALIKYGLLKGLRKSVKRILKCNPFFKGGIDNLGEQNG